MLNKVNTSLSIIIKTIAILGVVVLTPFVMSCISKLGLFINGLQ